MVNCLIVRDDGGDALIIDPGGDASLIEGKIVEMGLRVRGYLLTHGHMDHICALADVSRRFPAPIWMHPSDTAWAFTSENQMPPHYSVPALPAGDIRDLTDHAGFDDPFRFSVIHTPGHTPGSCCVYFAEAGILVAGDTLFRESVGRTDFAGGDPSQMTQSLKKLRELPAETVVYPGHGLKTTIGYECANNMFMRNRK